MKRRLSSLEGNHQRLDGGAMFGNVPKALWTRWATPDAHNRIPLACRCLLVQEPRRNILLETGVGAFFEPKLAVRYGVEEAEHVLLRSLAAHGLTHEDIHVVVLSHLHFDHAGGLLAAHEAGAPLRLLFPNATFVVGEDAWQRALSPHPRDRASFIPELTALLQSTGRLERVSGSRSTTLGDGWRLHTSHGHTPGLLLAELDMPDGPILFAGDLIPGEPWVHAPITMGYDRYPEFLIDEKIALLTELTGRGGRLFFTHDPHTALGTVVVDDRGRFSLTAPLPSFSELTA